MSDKKEDDDRDEPSAPDGAADSETGTGSEPSLEKEPRDEIALDPTATPGVEPEPHRADGGAGGASGHGKAWGLPFVRIDRVWTKFEMWLCTIVLLSEVSALTLWVALKGLSTPADGARAGVVFRALFGAVVLGTALYWALRKQNATVRRAACIAGVFIGLFSAKAWSSVGVNWSSNLLNWYQQASTVTMVGGLRGVGTRLTITLALLGGSLATAAGKHITIDLVTRYLKPAVRVPVVIGGWIVTSFICLAAAWGFFDHISIEDFEAKADASFGEKVGAVSHGLGELAFITRKQIGLDIKSFPHVLKGESYADWLGGDEWNSWLESSGFIERYGEEKIAPLRIPADAKRAPMVVIPGKGEPRGGLTHAANLVFPLGLFIIGLRFLLLSILTLSGHMKVDPEAHMDVLGKRDGDDKPAVETA